MVVLSSPRLASLWLCGMGLCLLSCGLYSSYYVAYEPASNEATSTDRTTDTPSDDESAACAQARRVYLEQIAPAIDGTCSASSCHAIAKIAGKNLAPGAHASNRLALLSFDPSIDGAKIIQKISGQVGHGGGNLSTVLQTPNITSWKEAEGPCSESQAD